MGMLLRDMFTVHVGLAIACILIGVGLDAGSSATTSWAWGEEDTFYTDVSLWSVCNGTRELTRRDKLEIFRSEPVCVFPTTIGRQWITVGLGMELLGMFFALLSVLCIIGFLISLKYDWIRSRSALTALIPLSLLAGMFNFAGCLIYGLHFSTLTTTASWSYYLDVVGVAFFWLGGLFCMLDLQGCCMKRRPDVGKGLLRPI